MDCGWACGQEADLFFDMGDYSLYRDPGDEPDLKRIA